MLTLTEPMSSDCMSTDGADRRRGMRIQQTRPVKVFEPAANRYLPGQTVDVSATGLQIELPMASPVRTGRMLSVHVGMSAESGSPLANRRQMIPAKVVWIRRDFGAAGGRGRLTAGVEFLASIAAKLDAA